DFHPASRTSLSCPGYLPRDFSKLAYASPKRGRALGPIQVALMVAALIRIALRRPYTFIVLAIVIALFGVLSAVSMATDIFPDIDIPVVAVAWTYTGLSPDDMAG